MRKIKLLTISTAALLLSGCATIVRGNDQTILFDTDPSEATCSIMREGQMLYHNFKTPASRMIGIIKR